mmetsp:Transcript_94067/g.148731  ORF Transcript_94067/g.148731 Transcript_94067/m.148731 type:complete len:736 (-) Transcript_94067:27-2234(-)
MSEPGEPATIRRLSAPVTSMMRKPSIMSPLGSPAFSPEVTWHAAVQSPPGLECATPAKLWPATPLLDAYKLSSPMVLGPRDVRKDLPEVLLLSPPGLVPEPKAGLVPLSEGLPFPSDETPQDEQRHESPQNCSANSQPKKLAKKAKAQPKAPGEKQSKKKDQGKQLKSSGDRSVKNKDSASGGEKLKAAGNPSESKEDATEMPEASKSQALTLEQASCSQCCICQVQVTPLSEQSDRDPNNVLIDGRRVCDDCYAVFESSFFVPKYRICCNFLCRRKWKQLTPKALILFCPPCKRLLEGSIVEEEVSLEIDAVVQMYQKWYEIAKEMAQILEFPQLAPQDASFCNESGNYSAALPAGRREQWRRLLQAFQETCPMSPSAEDVRNWNSVHGRKLYYRGVVHRGSRRFVCTVEASVELQEDLKTAKKIAGGPKQYHIIDWEERLTNGQEVKFLAFPNPSVNERDKVNKLARLLTPEGDAGPKTSRISLALQLDAAREKQDMPAANSELGVEETTCNVKTTTDAASEIAHKMPGVVESSPEEVLKISTAPATLQMPTAAEASRAIATRKVEETSARTHDDSSPENSPKDNAFASLNSAFGQLGSFDDLMQWTDEFEDQDMPAVGSMASLEKMKVIQLTPEPRASLPSKPQIQMSPEPRASLPNKPPGILRIPIASPETNPASSKSPMAQSLPAASPKVWPAASPKVGIKMGKAKPAPAAYRQSPLIAPKSPFATYFGD